MGPHTGSSHTITRPIRRPRTQTIRTSCDGKTQNPPSPPPSQTTDTKIWELCTNHSEFKKLFKEKKKKKKKLMFISQVIKLDHFYFDKFFGKINLFIISGFGDRISQSSGQLYATEDDLELLIPPTPLPTPSCYYSSVVPDTAKSGILIKELNQGNYSCIQRSLTSEFPVFR